MLSHFCHPGAQRLNDVSFTYNLSAERRFLRSSVKRKSLSFQPFHWGNTQVLRSFFTVPLERPWLPAAMTGCASVKPPSRCSRRKPPALSSSDKECESI